MPVFGRRIAVLLFALSLVAGTAEAGPIFLTGHDPDFHTQAGMGATLLTVGLDFAMGGTLNDNVHKFLWVESFLPATSGHLVGANALPLIGLTEGVDYDRVDAAGFALANLSNYTAIAVASSFGGMLTSAELNALIARATDIENFVNAGGGVFAASECEAGMSNCDGSNMTAPHGALFGFLPVAVSAVNAVPPFSVTPFGAGLGLTNADMNDPTHNSFGAIGGLNIVDVGANGVATTLAGNVSISTGTFVPSVPEPATLTLLGLGLLGGAAQRMRQRKIKK
jgi:hypothetical protein